MVLGFRSRRARWSARASLLPVVALMALPACGGATRDAAPPDAAPPDAAPVDSSDGAVDASAEAESGVACGDTQAACPSMGSPYPYPPSNHWEPPSCSVAQCGADAVYCSEQVGLSEAVPPGCTLLTYHCVPVSTGATCTTYFCCPPSDGGASPDASMDGGADGA